MTTRPNDTQTAHFANPGRDEICETHARVKTIAVVGLSPRPSRPSFTIARAMQRAGFRITPVRPLVTEVLGERAYPSLADVPDPIDLVNVFRAAEHVDRIVEACARLGLRRLWIQESIRNETAAATAIAHDIWMVMDRCIWRDFAGLCGGRGQA
jgi:predicted CoA-binding protein